MVLHLLRLRAYLVALEYARKDRVNGIVSMDRLAHSMEHRSN